MQEVVPFLQALPGCRAGAAGGASDAGARPVAHQVAAAAHAGRLVGVVDCTSSRLSCRTSIPFWQLGVAVPQEPRSCTPRNRPTRAHHGRRQLFRPVFGPPLCTSPSPVDTTPRPCSRRPDCPSSSGLRARAAEPFPSHTWLVPQGVPATTFPDPSTHVAAPVAHEVMPVLHGDGFPLQPVPAVQATQVPELLQTMLVPQLVPAGLSASSRQVGTPVLHALIPLMHAACGFVVQAWPAVHRVHWPFALQTWFAPQPLPAVFEAPSTQVCAPVAHEVTPAGTGIRVAGARLARGAGRAGAAAVADHVGAAGAPGRLVAEIQTDRRAGLAAVDACLARGRVGRAVDVGRAGGAGAVAVAHQVCAAGGPAGLAGAVDAGRAPVAHEVTPFLHAVGIPVHGWPVAHATASAVAVADLADAAAASRRWFRAVGAGGDGARAGGLALLAGRDCPCRSGRDARPAKPVPSQSDRRCTLRSPLWASRRCRPTRRSCRR